MPLPKPNEGESQEDFISRCMSDDMMVQDFPENDQRLAVCHDIWEGGKQMADMIRKTFRADIKEVNTEEGLIDMVIPMSTGSVDRDGEIIEPNAFKKTLTKFRKRPILLSSHDYRSLQSQIGEFAKISVSDDGLMAMPKYYIDEGNPEADWAFKLASKGKAAFSVGFIPIKSEPMDGDDSGNNNPFMGPPQRFTEVELLEISQVVVPSNRDAIQSMKSKGIEDTTISEIVDEILADAELIGDIPVPQIQEIIKGVISFQSAHPGGTPKAPDDTKWDAAKEVREAEIDDLKIMTLWVDSENPDVKQSYKLPHHEASGSHRVVRQGVIASGNVLQGARGGVDIPDGDVAGVRRHLGRHYREFDLTPPWEQEESVSQDSIADDLDYITKAIEKSGLNKESLVLGLKLANEILRLTGNDIPDDIQEKVGAVLNQKNKQRLEQIQDLAQEVLDSAKEEFAGDGDTVTPPEPKGMDVTPEMIAQMVGEAVKTEMDRLRGKV